MKLPISQSVGAPLNATGMPMIGPTNAITFQSIKLRLSAGPEKYFADRHPAGASPKWGSTASHQGGAVCEHARLANGAPHTEIVH
ncbi:hypothetical protein [Paraburkholderia domus]|jgi:hypothetical protein|uniref:hypothetical protein n=1 Tax=Paraburkholderia domus TaxID=2793075 RepID=UPI00191423EA|nr:hypothetical protein [Paraburkholderia domus]MBK5052691.1 hypothetical protein [Burkholderia sp. R-70006]MBK5064733.1 hypothetical protein [Burkholderia sp. R-70199]MBK5089509.1 hypothetical protein [Burkholderia sp. R-69927]MBK5168711.1 hypothetical protein [Burkholderia sp. R-70211]MBK5184019.1 hypothetical protein [Burkholderia sp. R-69749]MCI0149863.1 hypothetical protein [Paraburkholderia sediminicola]